MPKFVVAEALRVILLGLTLGIAGAIALTRWAHQFALRCKADRPRNVDHGGGNDRGYSAVRVVCSGPAGRQDRSHSSAAP